MKRTAKSPATRRARRALTRRGLRICDLELSIMEKRMEKRLAAGDTADTLSSDADVPKEMARVRDIFKAIAELTELAPDTEPAAGVGGKSESGAGPGAGASSESSEVDVFRREIADRLEKLLPPA